MLRRLIGGSAAVGMLIGAATAHAEPVPTPPPYCPGSDPGDLLNGITCDQELTPTPTEETPDPRPSSPPPGSNLPGGGDGGGHGGGGPGPN